MKYVGAKHQVGLEISKFLHREIPPDKVDGYLEPFCGSLGVFKQMIQYDYKKYIGSDIQPDIIQLWKELQADKLKLPKNISEKKWHQLKKTPSPNALKAVAGFGMSFGGDFFSGYIQRYAGNSGRNFYSEVKNSLQKMKKIIQKSNIKFLNKSYKYFHPKNMLIYCDPPYAQTTGYSTGEFNHKEFWETMRKWSKNNYVFISEESAPSDFKFVWKKGKRRTLNKKVRFVKYEKIYVYRYGLYEREKNKTRKKHKQNKQKTFKKPRKN
jgi:DNA adenine methylase